ncbi:MAG TPA: hypothetical protein VHC95_12960 [Opitutales bacterium]|nr:hypothetical protein [Opitutales bacterium]
MDWTIKSLARASFVSGKPFTPGEKVTCIIFRGAEGLQRADLNEADAVAWMPTGEVLGRWARKAEDENEVARRKLALASAEEVFLAFIQEPGGAGEDKDTILQLLALMLERKRILRPQGRPADGRQRYLHSRLQQEFSVPHQTITPERVAALREQLHHLAF